MFDSYSSMKRLCTLFLCLLRLSLLEETKAAASHRKNGVYVVYMGAAASSNNSFRNDHAQLLTSVLQRNNDALVHSYKKSFTGFAARLSEEEARSIAQEPGVVSVFPDPILKLHTTRSWDFLDYQTALQTNSARLGSHHDLKSHGTDTIIGFIDSGIWPESESFNDRGNGPIPSRWKGSCIKGFGFNSSNCNRKLIGARYYIDFEEPPEYQSARDDVGHGTHVASTAAGSLVPGASYYGLAKGTARGGSPGSRIAVYKACSSNGCTGSAILAAFDDAVADGVDVLSLSVGGNAVAEFIQDPIAIGGFHAVEKGIVVVCSGGNDGPYEETVANVAPWILTVAATTIDRDFQSKIVLGNNKVIKGEGINFASIKPSPVYPLIYGGSAKLSSDQNDFSARHCNTDSLDADKINGKIVLCQNDDDEYDPDTKLEGVVGNGGIGIILIDDDSRAVASTFGADPMTVINSNEADMILSYINSTKNPTATILETVAVPNYKPAPQVAYFSSRGPAAAIRNILKPDIAAPGVDILAAWMGDDDSVAPAGMDAPLFNIISGTSMACPHVSGIAATVKSRHPNWSPSAIRSAIMTTATQRNNMRDLITLDSGSVAAEPERGPVAKSYDIGAGEVSTFGPLEPGLVYETTTLDYLTLLCNNHYDLSKIKIISPTLPPKFSCPKDSNTSHISNMNYPSISITEFDGKAGKKIKRTVTNVGAEVETVYKAMVDAPIGLKVKVIPGKLHFTKNVKKLSYSVIFYSAAASKPEKDIFGSITWTNGQYKVRSPFVVSSRTSSGY